MGWCILLGTLAAYGGFCLLWAVFGWLLPSAEEGLLILPGRPGSRELSFVRRYLWLRDVGLLRCELRVADFGLGPEEKAWLKERGIELCGPEVMPTEPGIGAKDSDTTGNGNPSGHHRRCGVSEL